MVARTDAVSRERAVVVKLGDTPWIGCEMVGKPSRDLLHTEQCLERSGFCTRQVEQNVS